MSYEYRPMFKQPDEEESFEGATPSLRLVSAIAQVQQVAGQMRVRLDFDAVLHNLRGEIADGAKVEQECELTYPSERSPELQRAARGLERAKLAVRLMEAAAAFVRVYDEVTRK
jgi:hypothetical protein